MKIGGESSATCRGCAAFSEEVLTDQNLIAFSGGDQFVAAFDEILPQLEAIALMYLEFVSCADGSILLFDFIPERAIDRRDFIYK